MTTEERLERLERQLKASKRRNRWVMGSGALLLIGCLTIAATPGNNRVIRASRFVLEDENGKLLVTSVSGAGRAVSPWRLLRCFAGYPWMTVAVTARIHWQALRLWWKGVPFFAKPAAPARETSR